MTDPKKDRLASAEQPIPPRRTTCSCHPVAAWPHGFTNDMICSHCGITWEQNQAINPENGLALFRCTVEGEEKAVTDLRHKKERARASAARRAEKKAAKKINPELLDLLHEVESARDKAGMVPVEAVAAKAAEVVEATDLKLIPPAFWSGGKGKGR